MIAWLLLRDDEPESAEEYVRAAQQRIAKQGTNLQHVFGIEARVIIVLYRGQAQKAWGLLAEHERAPLRSGPLRMDLFATIFRSLHGIVAVAAGKPPRDAEREVCALLRHERCHVAAPMAALNLLAPEPI